MKKAKKIVSLVLTIMIVVSAIVTVTSFVSTAVDTEKNTVGTQSKSDNFSKSFTLTGNGATDMVSIAKAQNNKNQNNLGYSESWCADFVSDCAKLAGQSSAVPFNGVVNSLYNAVINAGGTRVSSAQAGDLVFFGSVGSLGHVGIATSATQNISGNIFYNGASPSKVCILNNSDEGYGSSYFFVRPKYTKIIPDPDPIPAITPKQCVSDGDYHIVSALNNSYGLNIAYNSTAACANVQLQNNMGDDNLTSLVTVKHIGSGYYTMTFKNSGKNLDVYNANKTSGTNVWQYDANNNDAQKWIIAPTGDGYFYIITKLNTNLYLDVSGGKAASATNIQVYNGNNSKAQKWKFIASGKPTESTAKSIKDGEYTISTALSSYAGLNIDGGKTDNGANIHLWNNMNVSTNNAIVTVKHLGNGLSSIVFKKSNKALDADITKNTSGANVQQWSYAGNRNQKWIIKSAGNGYYYIISHSSGLALDAYDGKSANGTNVNVHLWNKSNAQKWKFNPVKTRITYDPNGGKLYDDTISSTKFSASNSAREAGKIIIYTSNFVAKTTTNQYGDEFSFDKDGKKVGSRLYGTTTGLDIPSGGFVVSKHAESKFDLYNVARKAQYAFCDFNAYTAYFFNNEHDYRIATKLLANGSTYGTLPTPTKEGYTFDGWFTSANGGEIITSTSVFNGTSKLYAHWTKEIPAVSEETTNPNSSVPATEPVTDEPSETTNILDPTDPTSEPSETIPQTPETTATEPGETQNVTDNPTEVSKTLETAPDGYKRYFYLPSEDDENSGYEYMMLVHEKSGVMSLWNLEATDIKIDGVKIYFADIPEDKIPTIIQYQVYSDGYFVSNVTVDASDANGLDGKIIKYDGLVFGEDAPEETEPYEPEYSYYEEITTKTTNSIKATAKTKTVKAKKLKSKKQTVKPIAIKNAKGTVKVTKVKSGTTAKIYKKIKVNSKTGAITFKKGKYAKKTYKIKLKITVSGNSTYKSKTLYKTVKVKVK